MQDIPPGILDGFAFEILDAIDTRGEAMLMELEGDIGCWRTLDRRVDVLVKRKLLKFRVKDTGRKVKVFSLTMKGKRYLYIARMNARVYKGELTMDDREMLERIDKVLERDKKARKK